MKKVQRKLARHLYTITQHENESTKAYLNHFVKEEMNVQDWSNATVTGTLMDGLRNSTMLKYMVSISKNTTNPELITKIHHHIQEEKTYNLEAS